MSQHSSERRNRLADESSPYLLLHRSNPVDWYPWGEEALAAARERDVPIFLSVGYSTCYWCHVMERESFSNPEIAALMNKHFVNIKVDREERPELDEIYMAATQLLTSRGGWPNSVFLTPQLKPFYAGTYFPPRERGGMPGFASLVLGLADAWESRRGSVDKQADEVAGAMRRYLEERVEPGESVPHPEIAVAAAGALGQTFDAAHGGFGGAPKFPSPANLILLQRLVAAAADGHEESGADADSWRRMLTVTLDRMARGGIYDQLAGGFHRYATDREWLIPHFEKMLYDNGLLLELYARQSLLGGDPPELAAQWRRVIAETVAFLEREMLAPEGAFYAAIDAETDGEEGAFYVWTRAELDRALGEEDAAFLAPLLGFDGPPFFEGDRYVLHLPAPLAELAAQRRMGRQQLVDEVAPLTAKLLAARGERPRPLTDDKVLTDWNGLAIAGLALAGRALDDEGPVELAAAAARFLLAELGPRGDRPLRHTWRRAEGEAAGEAKLDAYLADYAYLIHGLLALHEVTGGDEWLAAARRLADEQFERLADERGGFYNAAASPDLLFRSKEALDGATPAANGLAALNLLELARRSGEERYREQAEATLMAFAPLIERFPEAARTLALAAYRHGGGEGSGVTEPGEHRTAEEGLRGVAEAVLSARLEWTGEDEGAGRPFTLHLEIAEGWHVNANPASEEQLIATRIAAADGEVSEIAYPPGEELALAFSEQPVAVYSGEVEINGKLTGDAVELTYQACDDERCLPVVTRRVTTES